MHEPLGGFQVVRIDGQRLAMLSRGVRVLLNPGYLMRRDLSGLCGVCVVGLFACGCLRPVESDYTAGEEVLALPQSHQQQIGSTLTHLFGTPAAPRFRLPAHGSQDSVGELQLLDVSAPAQLERGRQVFAGRCVRCHGVSGDGRGIEAAGLWPPPRDYRRGIFKFISTPYGAKPVRQDLLRTVREGILGVGMPDSARLATNEQEAVVDYVIMLSHRGELERAVAEAVAFDLEETDPIDWAVFEDDLQRIHQSWLQADEQVLIPLTAETPCTTASVLAGKEAFISAGCWKCHGEEGKGQGEWLSDSFWAEQEALPEAERIKPNYDAWGNLAPAADLRGAQLHGGDRPVDIYRRIYCGINGTPMSSFSLCFADKPEGIWDVVHFVQSLVAGGEGDGR